LRSKGSEDKVTGLSSALILYGWLWFLSVVGSFRIFSGLTSGIKMVRMF